ncbi:hypothetical protein [Candidatus Manganitrophus noduliformans]|uniref:Uncharacterized protein n=1 Tax=Candidatus Manganitrophus noduliformans TaxID=2606439 RepID=A0A7X6ID84_9BACT|nr:hypothetical protein [Candidatus Manganitrophus noduliformans]NKE73646.1 hypothetical protein [Candidatus Manganitrophus noduliformans]
MERNQNRIANLVNGFQALAPLAPNQNRTQENISPRMSVGYYIGRFGLKFKEADRLTHFLYLFMAEEDRYFLSRVERWVREIALTKGSIRSVLDDLMILAVCRIDPNRPERCCRRVRSEIIRYVDRRFQRDRRESRNEGSGSA